MADNTTLNTGTGGDVVVSREISHGGDTAKLQGVFAMGISGAEGSYTAAAIGGDATNGLDVDVTRVGGTVTVTGTVELGATALAALETITVASVTAPLAAGTNNIGDVDVLSVVPGTGATALGKAVDSAAGGTDTGVVMLGVRDDALTTLTPVDGDYVPFRVDSTGAAHVRISAGGIAGIADDAAFTPGTSEVLPIGFTADETSPDSVNEGDIGAARMSLDRKQYVIAHNETSTIYQNGTARTPVFVAIDAATSGDNTLVAAAGAGNKIRVHQLMLVAAGTVNARFESGAGGTALSGQMNLVANTGFVLPYSPIGWFETAANTLLNLELSAAVSVDGVMAYTVVT
jgi:hypothetical protein